MHYLIIGNGVAGTTAAGEIRKHDSAGEITIFSSEALPFYSRIRLVEYLAGDISDQDLVLFKKEWYESHSISLMLSSQVQSIEPQYSRIILADGSSRTYDRLLIASGGIPLIPKLDGVSLPFVLPLRTYEDARRIRAALPNCSAVTVLGGGLLGIETAEALRRTGKSVTVIETFPRLLPRQLDAAGAAILLEMLQKRGLTFVLPARAAGIVDAPHDRGIELEDGRFIKTEMVVLSAGMLPNVALAEALPIRHGRGIQVNDRLETETPRIYAAGDVAEHRGMTYGIWPAAEEQGRIAGVNMSGGEETYEGTLPATTLKVAGISLVSAGEIDPDGKHRSLVTSLPDRGVYRKIVVDGETVIGCILFGDMTGRKALLNAVAKKQHVNELDANIIELKG